LAPLIVKLIGSEPDLPEVVNPRMLGKLWVSSMGLSFEVAANGNAPRLIVVEGNAGRYVNEEVADVALSNFIG